MTTMICEAKLIGTAPIGFSRQVQTEKKNNETHWAHDKRTWREKMHVDKKGEVFIPAMALKICLGEYAQYRGDKIPGKGQQTFTKKFRQGIMVVDDMPLGIKASAVDSIEKSVPSDGKTGGGSRVYKTFPVVPMGWTTNVVIHVFEQILIDHVDVLERYLSEAGIFIGMGYFRPARNGVYGRWNVEGWKTRIED